MKWSPPNEKQVIFLQRNYCVQYSLRGDQDSGSVKSLEYSNVKDASGAVATGVRDTPDAALSLVHGLEGSTVISSLLSLLFIISKTTCHLLSVMFWYTRGTTAVIVSQLSHNDLIPIRSIVNQSYLKVISFYKFFSNPTLHRLFLIILWFRHNLCSSNTVEIMKHFLGLGHSWYPCDKSYMKIGPN